MIEALPTSNPSSTIPPALQLIGQVVLSFLRERISTETDITQTDRYILHQLDPEVIAAIAYVIQSDVLGQSQIALKLPRHFVSDWIQKFGLGEGILTTERATYWRNAACDKPLLLLANTGDDETQSLNLLTPINSQFIKSLTSHWIDTVASDLSLSDHDRLIWGRAMDGLQTLSFVTLDRFAKYMVASRYYIHVEGLPLLLALGAALPALQLPRSTTYFESIPEKKRTQPAQWRNRFEESYRKRAPYLRKYTPNQSQLSQDDLHKSFEKVKESINEEYHSLIERFIQSPTGWSTVTTELSYIEWEAIEPLFEGLKREKLNLGSLTLEFYADKEPEELLLSEEKDYLIRLAKYAFKLDEEGRRFYEAHRNELKENGKLKSLWDRYVFGSPLETDDFLMGLALSLERLFSRIEDIDIGERRLEIEPDIRSKSDLEKLNEEAGHYFAMRYKGIEKLCGNQVRWSSNKLFDYPDVVKDWKERKKNKYVANRSVSKTALQIKFSLSLHVNYPDGRTETYPSQLIWRYNPNYITNEFKSDWERLIDNPLVFCSATRETSGTKGKQQAVNLRDVRTLVPVYGKSRGSFVAPYKSDRNLGLYIDKQLVQLKQEELVTPSILDDIREHWEQFKQEYTQAVSEFKKIGLVSDRLLQQADKWSALLRYICQYAKGDWVRLHLLKPLLQIGSVTLSGDPLVEIVAPWHPLRMLAMGVKARYVGKLIERFLTAEEVRFGEVRLFFRDLAEDLSHPFYPEVVLGWGSGSRPKLLALTDTYSDYTLHESPRVNESIADETGENPTEAANCVTDLVKRYLALHPHESANLSVVLYNCDSARLPQTVVDKLGILYEEDEEVCCQVVLRHQTTPKLSQLYQRIIESADTNVDAYNASESTRDFMARLRISISIEQASAPTDEDGCPNDIVFSQDVISRHAQVRFFAEKKHTLPIADLLPARWSRRRPGAKDDMKSVVYLCCPVQTEIGWNYLTSLTTFLEGDWNGEDTPRLLPARQLDFQDTEMRSIFEETHNLGDWVVNYDELLDRRQLLNQNVRVIRYKQFTTQGRNLIISSKAPLGLLLSMVRNRLRSLGLDLPLEEERQLAQRFIDEANDVSGDIVLRAAKRGRNASELIGVVLSRYIIKQEIGNQQIGWYFLDDYADWLGQREQQIADILALSPKQDDQGNFLLTVMVAESKYIDYASLPSSKKTSAKQLSDTVLRIEDALFGIPKRFDRNTWLSRLSDLLMDGVQFPANAPMALSDWRQAIRSGRCAIAVRGYSHVFVSGPLDAPSCSETRKLSDLDNSYQEIFDNQSLRELILAFKANKDPSSLRSVSVDFSEWQEENFKTIEGETVIQLQKKFIDLNNLNPSGSQFQSESELTNRLTSNDNIDSSDSAKDLKTTVVETPQSVNRWAYSQIVQLLHKDPISTTSEEEIWLKSVESRCKSALQGFNLQAKLLDSSLTPNAALLRFQGSANLTVDQVNRKLTEFKTTYGLSVISVQPGLGSVVIAIERPERKVVSIEDIWMRWASQPASKTELPIAMREDNGEILSLSPQQHAPHTLIAGSTGSGKSVLMQNIILSIAATNRPNQAQIILIDPKLGVDYYSLEALPHLTHGIIDDQEQALLVLKELVEEMNSRYRRFRETKTANLTNYNAKVSVADQLPTIWVIHDEFAEWMMIDDYKQQVTAIVSRLGVKARAAGIYLVFAAQRPDANVMPMQLRANLGNRLILRVDSEGTSEIALGEKGAERLLGKGHLLAKLEGEPTLLFGQVPFVSDAFLDAFLDVVNSDNIQ